MDGAFQPLRSAIVRFAFPLSALAGIAFALLTVRLASAPEHGAIAGLTFELDSSGLFDASAGRHEARAGEGGPARTGRLVVTSVRDGGPAEAAGIRAGDLIERIDGQEIHSLRDVDRALAPAPSHRVRLKVERPGVTLDAQLPSDIDPSTKR